MKSLIVVAVVARLLAPATLIADDATLLPKGAKIYITPNEGFESYLSAAILKKGVPVSLVADRELAEFELTSTARSDKAGWAKTIFRGDTKSDEHASITIKNIKTGVVVYAYAYNMGSAFNGQQSAAESCAKHLKDRIEKGK